MQLNQISKSKFNKVSRRVGRGGKRGTFSGRGVKGQKSRSGRKLRPEWRDILKSIPKKRGYKFKNLQDKPVIVSLKSISKIFNGGEIINAEALKQKGLIGKSEGRAVIKVLGQEKLTKKFTFKGLTFSAGAKNAIIEAGGLIG